MRRRAIFLVPVVAASLPCGCVVSQGRSCDIRASGISMAGTVTDDDQGVQAEVELEAGDMSGIGTSLQLCADEGESLTVNGMALELTETYAGSFKYRVEFEEPDEVYTFELHIGSDEQTISADLVSPAAFSVDAPLPGVEVSRAQDLELTWSPAAAGEQIAIELIDDEILCLEDWSLETEDDGSHVVPAGAIVLGDAEAPEQTCQAEYAFTRRSTGEYPPQLQQGGSLESFVRRGLRFVSMP